MKKLLLLTLFIKMVFAPQVKADWVELTGYTSNSAEDLIEHNGVMYAGGYGSGIQVSYNNGVTWEARNNGLNTNYSKVVQCIAYTSLGLFIATFEGIYKTTNDGLTWEPKNNGIQIGPGAIFIFAYSLFEDDGALYAGTYNAIYKSTDGAESWTPVTPIMEHNDFCTFNKYNNMLLAGTSGNHTPVISSTNGGVSWTNMQVNGGFPTGAFSIYSEPGKIFVGTAIGMWYSTNNGANFIHRDAGLGADPYVFALTKYGNTLFAGTNAWVYKTTNDGQNWENLNLSGHTFEDANKLLIYDNKLYVAAYTGLWYRNIEEIVTGVENPSGEIPNEYKLSQNYPNPFNPFTKITYQIPKQGNVLLRVYDFTGKEVQTLVNEIKSAGEYSVDFNASSLSSGVYFYKLETDKFSTVKKMTVIK